MGATTILTWFGAALPFGVLLVLFCETGILLGIVLPGDTLLITAGLWAADTHGHHPHPNIVLLIICAAVGALLGAQAGFVLGRRAGRPLFQRPDTRLFKRHYVDRAEEMFQRYGPGKAVVLARFIPGVRTLMNPLAGILEMDARLFTLWQVVGGLAWTIGVTLAAYAVGHAIHNLDTYLIPIVIVIALLSVIPVALELRRARARSKATGSTVRPAPAGASQGDSAR
ncbi:MAG: DedA family protein [Acidimicrobiales bacterium]